MAPRGVENLRGVGASFQLQAFAVLVRDLDRPTDELELRGPQGLVLGKPRAQVTVEADHELGRGPVGDAPERRDHRSSPGVLERPGQAYQALAPQLLAQARLAGGEDHEVGVDPHALEDLPHLEQAVVRPERLGAGGTRGYHSRRHPRAPEAVPVERQRGALDAHAGGVSEEITSVSTNCFSSRGH